MTKIDIISGFLGAGKTTLIKKLLSEALRGEQVVLIENEFGDIAIDGGFLKETGIEIKEMSSGCICCSLVGDFGEALREVINRYHPARVIIEPSGVGKLSDVIKAVQKAGLEGDVVLNSYTTVADVTKCRMYMKAFGEFFANQIQFAKVVILSRTDTNKATEEKVADAVAMIREMNSECAIITTPIAELDGKKVLETMEEGKKEFSLNVPLPDDEARREMIALHLKGRPCQQALDFDKMSKLSEGYVASDIAYVVNEAAMIAAFNNEDITQELMEKTISRIHSSVRKEVLKTYDEIREKMDGVEHRNALPPIGFR